MKKLATLIRRIRLRTWISFGLILVMLPLAIFALYRPSESSASWYDEAYSRRQEVTFTHNAEISSPRSITYSIDTEEIINASLMQADCDDIRFTDINGNLLPYDLTGTCDNAATTFEVLFDKIVNGTNVSYVYYGNNNAVNGEVDSTGWTQLTPNGGDPSITTRTNEENGPSPKYYWKLDEGFDNSCTGGTNDVCDSTPSGLDGPLVNDTSWQEESRCYEGKCLYFDGTDDAVYFAGYDTTQFSGSLWFKPSRINVQQELFTLAANVGTGPSQLSMGFIEINSDNTIELKLWTLPNDTFVNVTGTSEVKLGEWQHVAWNFSASDKFEVYLNGKLEASNNGHSYSSINTVGTQRMYMGAEFFQSTLYNEFRGFIDEVKIYDYDLTAEQVLLDYSSKSGARLGNRITDNLTDNLIAHYEMNDYVAGDAQTISDSSGSGFNGTTEWGSAGMNCQTAGKYGWGCDLDGTDDYIDMGDNLDFERTDKFSFSFWMYPGANNKFIFAKQDNYNNAEGYYGYITSDGYVQFSLLNNQTNNALIVQHQNAVTLNQWAHVLITYDGSSSGDGVKIYVDGTESSTVTQDNLSATTITGEAFRIGCREGCTFGQYDGKIDDFRVYNRELTTSEVSQLYNYGPPPQGYWKMDKDTKTSTTTLLDSSINANHASGGGTPLMDETNRVEGKFGKAFQFNGTSNYWNMLFNSPPQSYKYQQYSISAWMKPDSTMDSASLVGDIFKVANTNGYCGYHLYFYNNAINIGNYTGVGGTHDNAAASFQTDVWQHVEATFDGNALKIYINGVLKDADTSISSSVQYTGCTGGDTMYGEIGRFGSTANVLYYKGVLDELKIYDYARTQSQVIEDMNAGHPIGGSPVGSQVAYWRFDEMYGQTTNDSIGTHNGTLGATSGSSTDDPTWTDKSSCKIGSCLSFDGGDYISLADDSFETQTQGAITGWFKRNTFTGNQTFFGYGDSASNSYYLVVGVHDSDYLYYSARKAGGGAEDCDYISDQTITDSNWHHYAFVSDISNIYMYLDGKPLNVTPTAGVSDCTDIYWFSDVASGAELGCIGAYCRPTNVNFFNGYLDETKIYSAPLTQEQVLIDMNKNASTSFGGTADEAVDVTGSAMPEPISHWRFEEKDGLTTYDIGSGKNNGTLDSSMTRSDWIQGKVGSGLDLDGTDDFVTIADDGDLDLEVYTISAWINPNTISGTGSNPYTIYANFEDNDTSPYPGVSFSIGGSGITDGALRFIHNDNVANPVGMIDSGSNTLIPQVWSHVVATITSGSVATIYINGRVVAQSTITDTAAFPNNTPKIGQAVDSGGTFNGKIDEVKVWDTALTQAQIAYEYNRGAPLIHYRLDECQGNSIYDAMGNYNASIPSQTSGSNTSVGSCDSGNGNEMWDSGTNGKFNYSLDFDGTDDYIELDSTVQFDTFDFSITGWFKTSSDTTGVYEQLWNSGYSGGSPDIEVGLEDNTLYFYVRDSGGTFTDSSLVSNTTLNDGSWHHFVAVANGDNYQLYVDGVLHASDTVTLGDVDSAGATARIGNGNGAINNRYFDGQIDDVRVYKYALSQDQINKIKNGGAGVRFGP